MRSKNSTREAATLTPSSWHGVTTVVQGNCGFGIAPTRPADRDNIMETLELVEGMNLRTQLEGNSFSEMIQRNTDGTHTLKADAFATADCKFELGHLISPATSGEIFTSVSG